jgi:predicted transcriptional regulator
MALNAIAADNMYRELQALLLRLDALVASIKEHMRTTHVITQEDMDFLERIQHMRDYVDSACFVYTRREDEAVE